MAKFSLDLAQIAVKEERVEGTAETLTNAEATAQAMDGGSFWEPDIPFHELPKLIEGLRREMRRAAEALEFERAAELRDRIRALERERVALG